MRSEGYGSALCVCVCYCFNSLYDGLFDIEMIPPTQQVMKSRIFPENVPLLRSARYPHSTQSAIYCGKHACALSLYIVELKY